MSSPPHHVSTYKAGKRSRPGSRSLSASLERADATGPAPQRSPALEPSAPAPNEGNGNHKKKRQRTRRAAEEAVVAPSTTEKSRGAAQSLLQSLSEVELQFQLEQDRAQRTTLAPRDIANLILWSVPAPVPLIESPRIFFIKNKSRVRNVAVIYVNGWSYDELLCTGVGLPRKTALATTSTPAPSSVSTTATESNTVSGETEEAGGQAANDTNVAAHWDKKLCSAMLSPVREGRCWARPGRGSGCAGGVQYCPLLIPSTRNELENDLWWRNDAPRRPGASSSSASSAPALLHRRTDSAGSGAAAAPPTDTLKDKQHGVGSLFHRALQAHAQQTGGTATSAGEATTATTASSASAAVPAAPNAFEEHQRLWQDKTLLTQYALKLPRHAAELTELGFTLTPPTPPPATITAENQNKVEKDAQVGSGEAPQFAVEDKEPWTCFAEPSVPSSAAAEGNASHASDDAGHRSPALSPRVVALDCEMVQVASGESALARATLVDVHTGQVVLDLLVKPQQRITDYLTRFSGIDQAMLDPVTITLADCQAQMKAFIDTETFVVGHSLENDFKACRFVPNCYVLDTAWLFPHPAGLPYKNALRFLAQKYLNRRIQQGSHDSAIDALVSAELTQLKLLHGPAFGIRSRVSVLGLITAAAGDVAETNRHDADAFAQQQQSATSSQPESHAASEVRAAPLAKEPVLDVQVRLFDDAVTLGSLLPTATATNASDSRTSAPSATTPPSQVGRIDAVPVRHDEDAMRKVVRALQRRAKQLQEVERRQQQADVRDGVQSSAAETPSFGLYWVQLTQTKVDVVLPRDTNGQASATRASTDPTPLGDEELKPVVETEGGSTDGSGAALPTPEQHTAAQFRVVHDTNRRVLRIIEACPEETLVIVLAGRCAGEASGNHFSRAQGTCFAFVKDSSATGPYEAELTRKAEEVVKETETTTSSTNGDTTAPASSAPESTVSGNVKEATVFDTTPPACQQQ